MDLDLTPERLRLERDAEAMLQGWLRARVMFLVGEQINKAIGASQGTAIQGVNYMALDLMKARKNRPRPQPRTKLPGNWRPEAMAELQAFHEQQRERFIGRREPEAQVPETVFDAGSRYARQHRGRAWPPTIAAGQEVFEEIIDKAYEQGLKEAASALLRDRNPPRAYQHYTRRKLQILARKNVKLVDTTTRRMVAHITEHGKPDNVDELLHKLFSTARCRGIAIDQVSKGYIRGAAEVLRQNGYRYIYWRTMMDERVCPICGPRESAPFSIMEFLKQAPAHPRCRCWPSTTRFDGSRDPDLHAKSILVEWDQAILRRRRISAR